MKAKITIDIEYTPYEGAGPKRLRSRLDNSIRMINANRLLNYTDFGMSFIDTQVFIDDVDVTGATVEDGVPLIKETGFKALVVAVERIANALGALASTYSHKP